MKSFIKILLPVLLGIIGCQSATLDSDHRPNIILIMADDVGISDISPYGSEISLPTLDRLAENGLRFRQFYNTARCCPTRASLMTGLYPHQAGVGHMMENRGNEYYAGNLSQKAVTIAEVVKTAGYATYMTGKWHLTPGHDKERLGSQENWPLQRGFDRFFGTIHGAGSFYDPNSLSSGNQQIVPGEDFYYTDAISDTAVKFIQEHNSEQPFFLYVPYTAAHWPMQAPEDAIAKYKGWYDGGWDSLRQERLKRMIDLGLIKPEWQLSDPTPESNPWSEEPDKAWHVRGMEVYAAMLDIMDQGIGRIVSTLEEKNMLDNTLIIYLQDNGACAEQFRLFREPQTEAQLAERKPMAEGEFQYSMVPEFTRDGRPVRWGKGVMAGPDDTYIGYHRMWANAGNTPFRWFKHWVHEGGIASPLIIHWPAGIAGKGEWRNQPAHLIDIMATCADVAEASYPTNFNGHEIRPLEGTSLVTAFADQPLDREALYWEHEGNRAIRQGNWKLVSEAHKGPRTLEKTDSLAMSQWELYDMEADRTETQNLAGEHPELVETLSEKWMIWAKRVGVIPKPYKD